MLASPETIILDYSLNANGGDAAVGTINQTTTITINDDDLAPSSMTNTIPIFNEDFENGMNGFTSTNPSGDDPWQVPDLGTAASQYYAIPNTNTTNFLYINDDDCNCDQNDVDVLVETLLHQKWQEQMVCHLVGHLAEAVNLTLKTQRDNLIHLVYYEQLTQRINYQ